MTDRGWKFLILAMGFFVLAVPLVFLDSRLSGLRDDEELQLDLELRQILLTEQEDLYQDLEADRFIESVLDELDQADGILAAREKTILPVKPGVDPGLFDGGFLERRLNALRAEYSLEPLLAVVADTDFRHFWIRAGKRMRETASPTLIADYSDMVAWKYSLAEKKWLTEEAFPDCNEHASEKGFRNFSDMRAILSERLFGSYWSVNLPAIGITQGFSDVFGNQTLFLVPRFFHSSFRQPRATFGGYVFLFPEDAIRPGKVLERALGKSRKERIRRKLVWDEADREPGFASSGDSIRLMGILPPAFLMGLRVPGPGLRPFLSVEVTKEHGSNPFVGFLSAVRTGGGIALAVFSLVGLSWFRREARLSAGLRWKLVGIVALVMTFPGIGVGLVSLHLARMYERGSPVHVLMETRNLARHLAMRFQGWLCERLLWNLAVKIDLQALISVPEKVLREQFPRIVERGFGVNGAYLLRADGKEATHRVVHGGQALPAYRFLGRMLLEDLGAIPKGKEKQVDYLKGDIVDHFWSAKRIDLALPMEGLEIPSFFEVQEDRKMNFFVLPSEPEGSSPAGGLAFVRMNSWEGLSERFIDPEKKKWKHLYRKSLPNAEIRMAAFPALLNQTIDTGWPKVALMDESLLEIVGKDAPQKRSGSRIHRKSGRVVIQVWERAGDFPLLVVAQAELEPSRLVGKLGIPVLILVGLFGSLGVLLMAELLSYLFIDPIKVLEEGSREIARGRFSTRVRIHSADEFAGVAASFNRMAEALQQRERLRRFLPERLVSNVLSGGDSDERRSGERVRAILLVSDIRGFTTLTERFPPDRLVSALNDYFTEMGEAITEGGGTVLKLIGDAIQAVFFELPGGGLPVREAVEAARGMRRRLGTFNSGRRMEGEFEIENGIGLAAGIVVCVELGSARGRRDFTVIGPAVGDAGRLESLTAHSTRSRIVVSSEIASFLPSGSILGKIGVDDETACGAWEIAENGEDRV